jgi:hypothetical protein
MHLLKPNRTELALLTVRPDKRRPEKGWLDNGKSKAQSGRKGTSGFDFRFDSSLWYRFLLSGKSQVNNAFFLRIPMKDIQWKNPFCWN